MANITFCDSDPTNENAPLSASNFVTHEDTANVCSDVLVSGAVLVSTTSKECRDSDADLDVDGDDTLEYGRAQYPLQ